MKYYCGVCGKQIVSYATTRRDERVTTNVGAVRGFGTQIICGYCAEELDDNDMFPEDATQYCSESED